MARVLWVTNLAAPYRIPVWRRLGESLDLVVGLLESNGRLAKDTGQNRGADWLSAGSENFTIVEYRTHRVRRGEDRHYTLTDPKAFAAAVKADVILLGGWDSPAYWQLLALAKLRGTAVVGFYESVLASQSRSTGLLARARSFFFIRLDAVVVPGPSARDAVVAMGVDAAKLHVGFNAVDVAAFSAALGFPAVDGVGHRFLYVGQLIERKNVDGILKAFAKMSRPADRLTLVGKGEQQPVLVNLAADLGLSGRVEFIDFVPNKELPRVMGRHDTLILASHVEVWGLVVNEALAAGMQVVVTRNCGVAASVEAMPGVLLAAADSSDLSDTLARARDSFEGRIQDPPIRRETPEKFADVFAGAFTAASAAHRGWSPRTKAPRKVVR